MCGLDQTGPAPQGATTGSSGRNEIGVQHMIEVFAHELDVAWQYLDAR
ncbi:hypothetical protein [Mycobacterium sp. E3198]|nr:hypothetical protein [Mycobacterium sp. E3198]